MSAVRLSDKMYKLLKNEAKRAGCSMTLIIELALRQLLSEGVKSATARQLIEDSYNTAIDKLTKKSDIPQVPIVEDSYNTAIDKLTIKNDVSQVPIVDTELDDITKLLEGI